MTVRLTQRQLLFVEHYLATGNATEAAKAAGYRGNRVTLSTVGGENMRKPLIADEIKRRQAEIRERSAVTLEAKRLKLWDIAQQCTVDRPDVAIRAIHELNVMDGDIGGPRTTPRSSFEELLGMVMG
jgi:phage terminase small subunit